MSTQFIQGKYAGPEKTPTAIHNDATGRSIIKYLPKAAGIAYDLATGDLKYNANGTIRTITSSTASLLSVIPQVAKLDLDGATWHNGIGGADRLIWQVPESVIITRIIIHTEKPSKKPMVATIEAQDADGTVLSPFWPHIDLGTGPVTLSNLDGSSHTGKKGEKDETRREVFIPKDAVLALLALDDPTGVLGTAYIFYVTA